MYYFSSQKRNEKRHFLCGNYFQQRICRLGSNNFLQVSRVDGHVLHVPGPLDLLVLPGVWDWVEVIEEYLFCLEPYSSEKEVGGWGIGCWNI